MYRVLRVVDNAIIGLPEGNKVMFLAKTDYGDPGDSFIAITAKDCQMEIKGSTNSQHREIPEAMFVAFDASGNYRHSLSPYWAIENVEGDALRVIQFARNYETLQWSFNKWSTDAGTRVPNKWCHFLGRRIEPEDILIAL